MLRDLQNVLSLALAGVLISSFAAGQTLNYSEDFESFALGQLAGQGGWASDDPSVVRVESTGLPGFAGRSVVVESSGTAAGGQLNLALSPNPWTTPNGRFEADVVITGSDYTFEFALEMANSIWNARVQLSIDGRILVASSPSGLLIWTPTSETWTPGVPFRLGLEVEYGNRVKVYKDGKAIGTSSTFSGTAFGITRFAVRGNRSSSSGTQLILDNVAYDTCPLPVNYCPPTPNSNSASGASIFYSGSRYLTANDGTLLVFGAAANAPCVFVASTSQASIPFGNGTLCLGAPRKRLGPTQVTSASSPPFSGGGDVSRALDLTASPLNQVTAGSTWNYQLWFRDASGGGAGTNLSGAVSATYCP